MSYKTLRINTRELNSSEGTNFFGAINAALDQGYTVAFVTNPIKSDSLSTEHYVMVYLHKKTSDVERYGFNLDSMMKT